MFTASPALAPIVIVSSPLPRLTLPLKSGAPVKSTSPLIVVDEPSAIVPVVLVKPFANVTALSISKSLLTSSYCRTTLFAVAPMLIEPPPVLSPTKIFLHLFASAVAPKSKSAVNGEIFSFENI